MNFDFGFIQNMSNLRFGAELNFVHVCNIKFIEILVAVTTMIREDVQLFDNLTD